MSFKKYKVTAQLNWDASNYKSVEVSAKRPENAKKLAIQKFREQFKTEMIIISEIKEL